MIYNDYPIIQNNKYTSPKYKDKDEEFDDDDEPDKQSFDNINMSSHDLIKNLPLYD